MPSSPSSSAIAADASEVVDLGFDAVGPIVARGRRERRGSARASQAAIEPSVGGRSEGQAAGVDAQHGHVGALVNFQWTVLATVNAIAVLLGSWLQQHVQTGDYSVAWIFLATGVPPLFTAMVGWRNIEESPVAPGPRDRREPRTPLTVRARRVLHGIARDRTILLLTLFIFFWNFSPSVGYIERSFLIDRRDFDPTAFGIILSAGAITFLLSILAYRWVVRRFRGVEWYHYLYAMIGVGLLSFPLSFFIYLGPDHPWWAPIMALVPEGWNPVPAWTRYEWFRLVFQTVLGFATIPAFIIPLTLAGEAVDLKRAGLGYAFLTALANVTNMLEGTIGAGLYRLFELPVMQGFVTTFAHSPLAIAETMDERTVILQLFVYISFAFTLLAAVFVALLRRHFAARGIRVHLAGSGGAPGAEGQSGTPTADGAVRSPSRE